MKRIILTSAVILATAVGLFAQTAPTTKSSTVALNVILHKVQSIEVTSLAPVELNYKNVADYNSGVQVKENNHLSVFSVGGFEVKVKSAATDLTSAATEKIQSSGITVKAEAGTNNDLGASANYAPEVSLGTSPQTLFSSTSGGIDQRFNVEYKGDKNLVYASAGKFVNAAGESATTIHSTTVTYSIEAK